MRSFVFLFMLVPAVAAADEYDDYDRAEAGEAEGRETEVSVGGYVQPQARVRQDDETASADEDGFRFRRARLTLEGARSFGDVEVSAEIESELTPEFQLLDAFIAVRAALPNDGAWELDFGQIKAPVSRQTLLSDSRLSFVEKAELATLAPDRQLGAIARVTVPYSHGVTISGGMFNGEGRNQVQNIDQRYLWAGRVELAPLGPDVKLTESAHDGDHVVVGASLARNRGGTGTSVETFMYMGVDVAFAMYGVSGSVEYLQVKHTFSDGSVLLPYRANGFVAQLAYLLPLGGFLDDKVEVGARFEEIDRNDTLPIVGIGDANQSLRYYTGVLSWYQAGHDLKVQLQASHIEEIEFTDRNQMDATYDNDTILLQAQYRLESL